VPELPELKLEVGLTAFTAIDQAWHTLPKHEYQCELLIYELAI
jgi:hypothetical protein